MTTIILINKECSIAQQKTRIKRETLYKKCGFKTDSDFGLRHTWQVEMLNVHSIEIWGQTTGIDTDENKFTLPSPLNMKTYYGTMAIVAVSKKGDNVSITIEKWNKIYQHLMDETDSEELQSDDDVEEDDDVSFSAKETNFAEGDSDEEAREFEDACEDNKNIVVKNNIVFDYDEDDTVNHLQYGSELEEEEYEYSDAE
jgi:hypothetical protein